MIDSREFWELHHIADVTALMVRGPEEEFFELNPGLNERATCLENQYVSEIIDEREDEGFWLCEILENFDLRPVCSINSLLDEFGFESDDVDDQDLFEKFKNSGKLPQDAVLVDTAESADQELECLDFTEYHIIEEFLAERITRKGGKVGRDWLGNWIYCVEGTGAHVYMDDVIVQIANEEE